MAGTPVKSCMSTRAGHERELTPADLVGGAVAIGKRTDVVGGHVDAVFTPHEVLQQDAQ